jgi:hypothetical protein
VMIDLRIEQQIHLFFEQTRHVLIWGGLSRTWYLT